MAPPDGTPRGFGYEAASPRTHVVRILILLIAATCLLVPGAGRSVADVPQADKPVSQIAAKLRQLGTKPATAELTSDKALHVRRAISAGDFGTADRIAADVLARSRIENWRYYPFEDFIQDVSAGPTPQFGHRLDEWAAKEHASALPFLFRARYFYDTGWAARGEGFVAKTKPERLRAFVDDLKRALADVNAAIDLDARNPYSFYLRLRILHGFGPSPAFGSAFAQAIARNPAYYPPYEISLDTLQPRWGGSIPAMYHFVDKYAGGAARFSPLRLLYLSLYRHLLSTASVDCIAQGGNADRTVQCIDAYMQKSVRPGLEQRTLAALQLYDHTDRYEFGIAVQGIISDLLATYGADTYSGTVLQLAATSMHSDTQLVENKPGRNDYIVDELIARSWHNKGFYDNEMTKYKEALADARSAKFPGGEERDVAIATIYEQLSLTASEENQYADEIAYERAALLLGARRDAYYICHGYYELKRFDEAIKACSDSMNSTDNAYARYWRGVAYYASGRFDQALPDLTNVADGDSGFAPYAAVDVSMIYFHRRDNRGALVALNKYTFLYDPNRTEKSQVAVAYNNCCYAHMQLGLLKKALDDCTQSLKYGSIPDAFRKEQELMKRLGAAGLSPDGKGVASLDRSL